MLSLRCHTQVGVKDGVVLLTYSSLISAADSGASRLQQLVDWCKPGFDGLIVFDGGSINATCPSNWPSLLQGLWQPLLRHNAPYLLDGPCGKDTFGHLELCKPAACMLMYRAVKS